MCTHYIPVRAEKDLSKVFRNYSDAFCTRLLGRPAFVMDQLRVPIKTVVKLQEAKSSRYPPKTKAFLVKLW